VVRREILIGITVLVCGSLLGCGSGDSGSSNNGSTSRQILAKNVLLTSAHASLADKGALKKEVDATTTVMADNVVIDTAGNSLTSTNLQDALDKEMAIDLSKLLPGTTWTIANKVTDTDEVYGIFPTGRVSFSANTLTIDEGAFAAAGLAPGNTICADIDNPISYEIISNSIMCVSFTYTQISNPNGSISGGGKVIFPITIFAHNRNTLSLLGYGGCGSGSGRISILTKIQ
jgi:hypothetical protein